MQSADLAFYTCDELIAELVRRKTFYGCVVQSAEEHRQDAWQERTFRVHFNQNLDQGETGRLLDAVAGYINLDLE